jgi:hypothetical protein
MDIEPKEFNLHSRQLNIITRIDEAELVVTAHDIQMHVTRRIIDTLHAELLPVMRERVSAAIDALAIARCIEGEVAMAVHDAFGGK